MRFLILTLGSFWRLFNMAFHGLIMLVKDKGRDIAILRTMGATRGMVMRIFLFSGASIGVLGTPAQNFILSVFVADNIRKRAADRSTPDEPELFRRKSIS